MWKGAILPRVGGFTILIQKNPPPTDQFLDIKLGVYKESWETITTKPCAQGTTPNVLIDLTTDQTPLQVTQNSFIMIVVVIA